MAPTVPPVAGLPPPGRAHEAAVLLGWLPQRPEGGGLGVLRGPVGSGRSTLVRWLVARARAEDLRVLATRAAGPMLEPPLGAWARLLAQAEHDERPPGSVCIGAPDLLDVVREAVAQCPTLVVIDDADGLDEVSLRLLVQLAPLLEHRPVRIVVTLQAGAHPEEAVHGWLLSQLLRNGQPLELGGLPVAAIAEAVTMLAGDDAVRLWAERATPRLVELGGRTPLLLGALVRDLGLRDGARPEPDELAGEVLRTTRQVVRTLLEELSPSVREVLELVAFAGARADPVLVAAALGRSVGRELGVAEDAGMLERSGTDLRLASASYADELRVAAEDPDGCNLRLAAALLRAPRDRTDELLALRHLIAAGPAADPTQRRDAARRVLAGTVGSAAPALARPEAEALEALWRPQAPTDPGWSELGLRVADAWFRAGNRSRSWVVAEQVLAATSTSAPDLLIAAALALARGRDYAWSVYAAGRQVLDVAHRCPEDHPRRPVLLARAAELVLALPAPGDTGVRPGTSPTQPVAAWRSEEPRAIALIRRALDGLRPTTPSEVACEVRRIAAVVLRAPDQLDERLDHARWALEYATGPEQRALAAARVVVGELELGRRPAADRALAELAVAARTLDDPALLWREETLTAMLALASGQPVAAATHREQAFVAGQQVDEPGRWVARLVQTAFTELEHRARPALPAVADAEFAGWHPLLLAGRCLIEHRLLQGAGVEVAREPGGRASLASTAAAGMTTGAVEAAAVTTAGSIGPDVWSLLALVGRLEDHAGDSFLPLYAAYLADVVGMTRDVAAAAQLLPHLEPLAGRIAVHVDGFACHGSLARGLATVLGVLGRHTESDEAAAEAAARDRAAGLTLFELQGELDALLRARARRSRPEPALREQLLDLAVRADQLGLGRLGGDARRAVAPDLRAQLRPRDLEVLELLAAGYTNAAIAQVLGFSVSTIRKDTIRLFQVLSAGNRREAVDVARRNGLIA